jgi:hypothetical protein
MEGIQGRTIPLIALLAVFAFRWSAYAGDRPVLVMLGDSTTAGMVKTNLTPAAALEALLALIRKCSDLT